MRMLVCIACVFAAAAGGKSYVGAKWPTTLGSPSNSRVITVVALASEPLSKHEFGSVRKNIRKAYPDTIFHWYPTYGDLAVATREQLHLEDSPQGNDAVIVVDSDLRIRVFKRVKILDASIVGEVLEQWLRGRKVYDADCARGHGKDGALDDYPDIVRLDGIHERMDAEEVLYATDASGFVPIQNYSKRDREALAAYVLSLPKQEPSE